MDEIDRVNARFTEQQAAEIRAQVARDMPRINEAVETIVTNLDGMSDVSQKQALLLVLMHWIDGMFKDMPGVERFTAHLKTELDIYIAELKSQEDGSRH